MTPRKLGELAQILDNLETDSHVITYRIKTMREWLADCTQPAFAEAKMSREFCRCDRCAERRERRVWPNKGAMARVGGSGKLYFDNTRASDWDEGARQPAAEKS